MNRRDFLTLVGAASLSQRAVAQTSDRVRRIAILMEFAESDPVLYVGKHDDVAHVVQVDDSTFVIGSTAQAPSS